MRLRLFLLFVATFVTVYGSANLITGMHEARWPMPPTRWPFWPSWALVYLSLDLLLPLAFARVDERRLGPFTAALLFSTLIAWPLFLLLPLQEIPVSRETPSLLFDVADRLNLSANYLPSLHVTYALLSALFLGSASYGVWGAAIAVSTLVTHQHYTVDVLAGVLLALLAYRWGCREGTVEALCLAEFARCASRHRRYATIAMALYALSLFQPRRRQLARVGFCYLQRLDDLLDGHLSSRREPEEIACDQLRALRGEREFGATRLDRLGKAFSEQLEQRGEGQAWALAVIEEMMLDRRRVRDGLLLEEQELLAHLRRTFEMSLNLMLLAADSPLRAAQVPWLVEALGWCSVVRDEKEDAELGLVNVPAEFWQRGEVLAWHRLRYAAATEAIAGAQRELDGLRGVRGHRLLELFYRSVAGYARREQILGGPRSRKVPSALPNMTEGRR